jgi:hypothetical protein
VTATRHKAPIYDRARLGAGDHIDGPAIITQLGATTFLLLGQTAEIHPLRRLFVHANLGDETRYWWFESTPLQQRVCKLSVPREMTISGRPLVVVAGAWYAGRNCLWSTDHQRQKRFDNQHAARVLCHELRSRCPRNAEVITSKSRRTTLNLVGGAPTSRVRRREADAPSS